MVIEDSIKQYDYARLLIADCHLEYPLRKPDNPKGYARCELMLYSFGIEDLSMKLRGVTAEETESTYVRAVSLLFPDLPRQYNGEYDYQNHSLWVVQGNVDDLEEMFFQLARDCEEPIGGDDQVFDYWPNAMDMLIVFAKDLYELTGKLMYFQVVKDVFETQEKMMGPAVEWEADYLKEVIEKL